MIACYLTLKGDAGLPLIDELFLKNTKSQYSETYSAIMVAIPWKRRWYPRPIEGSAVDASPVVAT